ncbi:predicted protein [Sclerotinia sclerotiorum 1980 UF-70]|uniref:Uncharacterized protein n=1 Tax=Sclerotinia sclerotiorum (strain ATCC 18683 / 1980 / Ss-1) TaxID=665079 RepID=A7EM43_SCLS1|nr:predicted protein [Sclerotinia sclerotiorum 1980 UF-70]EDO03909.1 predicted protein [Sclerotinia sclerotiorum 1980 UF-70]
MALEDQDGLGRSLEMDDGGRGLARGVLLSKYQGGEDNEEEEEEEEEEGGGGMEMEMGIGLTYIRYRKKNKGNKQVRV